MHVQLTQESHVAVLHYGRRYGNIIYRSPDGTGQNWQKVAPNSSSLLPDSWAGGEQHFVLPNEYWWGEESQLQSLTACFVDIDQIADAAIAFSALDEAHCPRPSVIVYSGSGMHFYWLLRRAPAVALPGWKRIQNRLHDILTDLCPPQSIDGRLIRFGADPTSKSCVKNLRLVGSKTKGGEIVTGFLFDTYRYSLRELEKTLGLIRPKDSTIEKSDSRPKVSGKFRRMECRLSQGISLRAEIAPSTDYCAENALVGKKLHPRLYKRWLNVECDLYLLAGNAGRVPEGIRDKLLFAFVCCQAWLRPPHEIYSQAIGFVRMHMHEYESEVRGTLDAAIRRAFDAARGKRVERNGKEIDPRYSPSDAWLREQLTGLIAQNIEFRLRALASKETKARRELERRKHQDAVRRERRRQERGREKWRESLRDKQSDLRMAASALKRKGFSQSDIAKQLNCHKSTISRALKPVRSQSNI